MGESLGVGNRMSLGQRGGGRDKGESGFYGNGSGSLDARMEGGGERGPLHFKDG